MNAIYMEKIFKALADQNRRKMLDIIKNNNGIIVNDLTNHFKFTRFAVMKHLKILEDAGLVVHKKEGKFKKLFVNAIPIQMVYDRWISGYSKLWASSLTSLKYKLEEEPMSEKNLSHIFVVYIKTTKEKLWHAITDPSITKLYFHNTELKSELKPGSKIEYLEDIEGSLSAAVFGEILEIIPNKKLVHTFNFRDSKDKTSRVTYELNETEYGIKLTLTHDQFDSENETYKSVVEGWPFIISGLKTYLETGKTLD
jgi:uncharacterized protein YndB with AHSA1/START domain/biotin operon repressor